MSMSRFFVPTTTPEDWRSLLADPDKHWRTGYSAKALAYCWQEADDFPLSVKRVFEESGIKLFQEAELLLAFPEYKVALPGGRRASQNDILVLARGNRHLIVMAVEGKVNEQFGELVVDWKLTDEGGKAERLAYLCRELQLDEGMVGHIRYQLLHRTASAVIEAKRFNAKNALLLVHSFSQLEAQDDDAFQGYRQFLGLFDACGEMNSLVPGKSVGGVNLYFAWVKGERKYLEI